MPPIGKSQMATVATSQLGRQQAEAGPSDRMFYSGMAVAMAIIVFIGFARTYYLSAYFGTHATLGGRPFSTIIRVHAMLFTTWVLLFTAQTSLVAAHRVAIHRR